MLLKSKIVSAIKKKAIFLGNIDIAWKMWIKNCCSTITHQLHIIYALVYAYKQPREIYYRYTSLELTKSQIFQILSNLVDRVRHQQAIEHSKKSFWVCLSKTFQITLNKMITVNHVLIFNQSKIFFNIVLNI